MFQLPRNCRTFVAISPANQWGWAEIFANKTTYLLEMLLWQNAYNPKKKAEHRAKRPKPFIPDFMKKPDQPGDINDGVEAHSSAEIDAILAAARS